nr:hypothetical protein [Tanacetum cinerariifolium]
CGNILSYGACLKCNSGTGNSFTYDTIPEAFDEVPNPPPQCHFNIYLCQICECNSHYGYECSQRIPLVYEPEPCYTQNFSDNDYSHDFPGVNPLIDHHCCYECGNSLNDFFCYQCTWEFCGNGAHIIGLLMNLTSVNQRIMSIVMSKILAMIQILLVLTMVNPRNTVNHPIFNAHINFLDSQNELTIAQNKIMKQMTTLTSMCEMVCQIIQKKQEKKRIEEEHAANAQYWKILACCDDDDDYNSAITPNESEGKNGGDVPACFTTFSNILFDAEYEFDSSDDQSLSDEDFSKKIFSNPLFEEEIIPMKLDQHHFNAESDLIESMLNHDSSIIPSSSKIDSLLDEFASELTLLKSIPPGIDKTDSYPEEDIRLIERLLYDNSSPHPDSFMEEIDLSFNLDDPMPPGIKDDDDDSERDILILEELPSNYSLSLPEKSPNILSHRSLKCFQISAKCPMMIHGKNIPILDVPLFHFYPLDQFKYGGNWVKLSDLKQALRGRHPMLIIVQYSRKLKDSCQRILSSKSSFPQLQLGIILLHLAGSQPMLKSSYKAEDGVIISIPPLVDGVADVVVEI